MLWLLVPATTAARRLTGRNRVFSFVLFDFARVMKKSIEEVAQFHSGTVSQWHSFAVAQFRLVRTCLSGRFVRFVTKLGSTRYAFLSCVKSGR